MTSASLPALRPDAVIQHRTEIHVPGELSEVVASLDALGGAINAGGWATAACVFAWTYDTGGGRPSKSDEKSPLLNVEQFAELGIRGLASRDSVRKYRSVWARAVERGWAKPAVIGEIVGLPQQDFRESEAHVGANSGESEWFTPREYIEAARRVMGQIDLDPASTAVANEIVGAARFFSQDEDGLSQPWSGNVWLNPPYSQPLVGQFCAKLVEELAYGNVGQAIALTNNATETAHFQRMATGASAICFPAGRVKFWHPEKESATPLQGQAVLYFGKSSEAFRTEFGQFGFTVSL